MGTAGILSDPSDELDDDYLEDDVDSNNDEGNRLANEFGIKHVVGVLEANWLLVHHLPADPYEPVLLVLAFSELVLFLAEALHDTGKMGLFP